MLQKEDNLDKLFSVLEHNEIRFEKTKIGDSDFILGCRSTSLVAPNDFDFLHDLSHLVQFSDTEIKTHYIDHDGKLKFNVPHEFLFNRYICEPKTDQISMRELETFYIQYIFDNTILEKGLSFEEWIDKYEIIDLLDWLPDSWNFGYKPTIEHVLNKAYNFIEKWNYDKVFTRWKNLKVS